MAPALAPYLRLTAAVRAGDLSAFTAVAAEHGALYAADGTSNLVTRLHHNVIRTGLRRISLAYSRISLKVGAAPACVRALHSWQRALEGQGS